MSKYSKFVTTPLEVEACRVTSENMNELAGWSGGRVQNNGGRAHIKLGVKRGQPEKFGQAFEGDWIVAMGKSFRVYTNSAFEKSFNELEELEDFGTPLFDQIVRELQLSRAIQRPDEDTAQRLIKQFVDHRITANQLREQMGMPVAVIPEKIMGRPYVQPAYELGVDGKMVPIPPLTNAGIAGDTMKIPTIPNPFEVVGEGVIYSKDGPTDKVQVALEGSPEVKTVMESTLRDEPGGRLLP